MRLWLASDIHTEFYQQYGYSDYQFRIGTPECDVLVLAGDVGVFVDKFWPVFSNTDVPIIYVPGNHEYYYKNIDTYDDVLKASVPPHVILLQNESVVINGVRFLGTTLWSDFCFYGEWHQQLAMNMARDNISDYYYIQKGKRLFTPEDSAEIHKQALSFLRAQLSVPFDGPTVVVTHHLPSSLSVHKDYVNNDNNPYYASRLEYMCDEYDIALWLHGHTHKSFDYMLYDTRVVCNPVGYPSYMNEEFCVDKIIDL